MTARYFKRLLKKCIKSKVKASVLSSFATETNKRQTRGTRKNTMTRGLSVHILLLMTVVSVCLSVSIVVETPGT